MILPVLGYISVLLLDPLSDPQAERGSSPPGITIHSASAPSLKVFYLNLPWGPSTFAAMERGGDSYYAKRTWPFARLESTAALTLEQTKLPPGNYALVFHPNTPDDRGMSLEVRKIQVAEFLEPGNVMTRTPEGVSVWRAPIRFEITEGVSPHLAVDLAAHPHGVSLIVRYGDRRLVQPLAY
jgi:hypothetical protein